MKKIKSYEYRIGWGGVDDTVKEVNNKLEELAKKGIEDVEVDITTTGKGVIYTLVWKE